MKAVSHQKSLFMYLFVQFISTPTVYAGHSGELTMAQQAEVLQILRNAVKGSSENKTNSRTFPSQSSKSEMKSRFDDIKQTDSFILPEQSTLSKTKKQGTKKNNLTNQPPQTVYNDNSQNYHIYGTHQTDPQIQELLKEINNLKQSIAQTSPDAETKKALQEATLQANELQKALDVKNQQEELIKNSQKELENKNKELENTLSSNTASSHAEVSQLKLSIQTLEQKASNQEDTLKQKDSELQEKAKEVESTAKELKKIQDEKQTLSSKLEALQSDLEKSKKEANQKSEEAEKILQEKIAALESEKNKDSKTQVKITELNNQLETIQKEKLERDGEVTKLKTDIENSNKKAAKFELKVKNLEAKKNEVEKNKALSETQKEEALQKLQTEKTVLEKQIQSISTENEQKIQNLTTEMNKDKKELEQVKAENASLKTQLEEAKKNQNEVMEEAKKAGTALQEKINKIEEEKKNIQAQQSNNQEEKDKRIFELQTNINTLTNEKSELNTTLQTEQKNFTEASKKIEEINKEIEKLKSSGENQATTINQLEKTAKDQTELLKKAQKELSEKTEEANLLTVQVTILESENQRLTKELESLKNDKQDYTKKSGELQEKLQKEINALKETKNLSENDKLQIQQLTAENEEIKKHSHEIEMSYKKLEEVSDGITKELKKKTDQIIKLDEYKKALEESFKKAALGQNSKDELTKKIELLNQEKIKLELETSQALENLKQKTTDFENSLKEKESKITELNNTVKLKEEKMNSDLNLQKEAYNQLAAENRNLKALNEKNLNEAIDKLKDQNLSPKYCEEIKSEIRKLGQSVGWTTEALDEILNQINCHQTLALTSKTVEANHSPPEKNLSLDSNVINQVNTSPQEKKIVKSDKELSSKNSGNIAPRIPEGENNAESPALTDLKNQITDHLDQPENGDPFAEDIKNIFDKTIKMLPLDEQEIVKKFIKAQILRRKNKTFKKSEKYRKPQNTPPVIPSAVPSFEEMEKADDTPGLEDTNHMNTSKKIEHPEVLPQKETEDQKSEIAPQVEEYLEPSMENPAQKHFQEIEKVNDTPELTQKNEKNTSKLFWVIGPDDLDLDKLPKIPQEPIEFNKDAKAILEKYPPSLSAAINELMDRKKYLKGQSFDTIQKQPPTQKIFYRFTTNSIKKIQFFLDELKQKVIEKIQTIDNTKESKASEGGTKRIILNNWKDFLNKIDTLKETVQKSHQTLVKTFAENKDPLRFKQWTDTKVTNSKKHSLPLTKSVGPGVFNK
jgi:chromosome segregation ATPase